MLLFKMTVLKLCSKSASTGSLLNHGFNGGGPGTGPGSVDFNQAVLVIPVHTEV